MRKRWKWILAATLLLIAAVVVALPYLRETYLIYQLRRGNSEARCRAARALGEMQSRRAVPVLIQLLKDPGYSRARVHCKAAIALGKIGDRRATQPLIIALTDPEHRLRGCAAIVLGRLDDPAAIRPLEALLGDPAYGVVHSATEALVLELDQDWLDVRQKTIVALSNTVQTSTDEQTRAEAASLLRRIQERMPEPAMVRSWMIRTYRANCSSYPLGHPLRERYTRKLIAMGVRRQDVLDIKPRRRAR